MSIEHIHFLGIGGVGMAGLAVLLKSRGAAVTGCDVHASPRTRWLESLGIPVATGHSPDHLADVDELIVTPAVPPVESELAAALEKARRSGGRTFRVRSRGETLAALAGEGPCIAVCGSHGKTTTATWIARLLKALGEDPSWCIGGETGDFPVAGVGKGPLVVEADESDGTLARYRVTTLVVTNCEYDHADHFRTRADYVACYDAARRNAGDVIESERLDAGLLERSGLFGFLSALAPHNRRNARTAVEVALRRGHALADIARALPGIVSRLPDRRFQGIAAGVYIDYAHHPTEMACAVQMARAVCRGRLVVLFQPHRYSRTKALLGDFPAAFAGADEVVLCPTYPAFERPLEGGDVADLYAACRGRVAARLLLAQDCAEAWTHAMRTRRDGDVVLVLGAGDIVARLKELPPVRRWIGQGSNTWKSDLDLGIAYVRTTGRADLPGASLGIPWMAGIPGTVGGWIKMNAGAFGHSISEALEQVKVDGAWLPSSSCGFAYRHSDITGEIQDFKLRTPIPAADPASDPPAADYLARRKAFPSGTYGSFFKNPPDDFAGRLLEAAGAKELRVGGAYVWSEHANVIVRGADATASDVLALARLMRNRVWFRFGVALEPEVAGLTLGKELLA